MTHPSDIEPFLIDSTPIGPGQRCLITAEVAQAHDGSLGAAHAYIDAVAEAGAFGFVFSACVFRAGDLGDLARTAGVVHSFWTAWGLFACAGAYWADIHGVLLRGHRAASDSKRARIGAGADSRAGEPNGYRCDFHPRAYR